VDVERTERGWVGHHILGGRCRFRRNTLLVCGGVEVVVSTVGLAENPLKGRVLGFDEDFVEVGAGRYFETMAFFVDPNDKRYHDADISRQVRFDSPWCISKIDADDKANEMHEAVVKEITNKLSAGELVDGQVYCS